MSTKTKVLSCLTFLCLLSGIGAPAHSEAILRISGKIAAPNDRISKCRVFSEQELIALPQHAIETSTSWTPKAVFFGPRLSDVLAKAGANGTKLEIHALDDYTYTIPVLDAARYGVILAHTMNESRLKVNTFGPLFLIYPRDKYQQELKSPDAEAKFVWQVDRIVVR